jgi:hypothetical protein
MRSHNRREFLADVGRGMLIGSVGATVAAELGLANAFAGEDAAALSFGKLESLVSQMQQTPADKIVPAMIARLKSGTDVKTLTAAAALANARTFGGEDYVGFHSFMALVPAYEMSRSLPSELAPLPVLKVVHRNTNRIQEKGGRKSEVLKPIKPAGSVPSAGEPLQAAVRKGDVQLAERIFAKEMLDSPGEAYNHLQYTVQDAINVHRVVLAWRAWETLDIVGKQNAHTLLRQSVHFCCNEDGQNNKRKYNQQVRVVLPKLMDQYKLLGKTLGHKKADDQWVDRMATLIFRSSREKAADAVAAALAEGIDVDVIGEAISLAACRLVLHDPGRPKEWARPGKPPGSVHGDSVGVHASDAANAWRHIARVSNHRNRIASLIVGAYHTAGQSSRSNKLPYPLAEHRDKVRATDPGKLLKQAEDAIRHKDQATACAAIQRYGSLKKPAGPVFAMLLQFATSEDGALHAEKYFRTVQEEFKSIRGAFRWEEVCGLARVTASEYGTPAPGYKQARELLGLS